MKDEEMTAEEMERLIEHMRGAVRRLHEALADRELCALTRKELRAVIDEARIPHEYAALVTLLHEELYPNREEQS